MLYVNIMIAYITQDYLQDKMSLNVFEADTNPQILL